MRTLITRSFLLGVSLAAALMVAACAGSAAPAAPAPAAAPAAQPKAAPAAPAEKPAAPAEKPAAPAKPAAQPAKPAAAAPASERKQLLMGTTQSSSGVYPYWVAAAKAINAQVPDVNVTPVESGASVENINRMGKGEFHLGQVSADTVYKALNGIEPWAGDKQIKDMRVLWTYDVTAQVFVVREDSGVKKLEDLQGKDYNPGIRGSASETLGRAVFDSLGIQPKFYVGGTADAVAAVKDKRIVGFLKGSAPHAIDAAILDVMTTTPIRVLAFSKEQIEKVLAKHPYYSTTEIPPSVYKADWNAQPIPMLAQVQMGGTRASLLTPDQAYRVTKAIVEDNRPGGLGIQMAAYGPMKGRDIAKLTVDTALTPLHAGAQKYYQELGLQIADKLKSPEAK